MAVASQVRDLRQRIARNPGDASSYLALVLLTTQPGGIAPLDEAAVLGAATRLAPQHPMLQRVLASRALERKQWSEAVPWLIRLVENHHDAAAAQTLASLVGVPEARAALVAALRSDSRWVEPLLRALPEGRVPQAMPLLEPAWTLRLISPEQAMTLIGQLKSAGAWTDAYALWLKILGQPTPLIYNGGFEQGFIRGGFDWERQDAGRSGVQLQQLPVGGAQGRALELAFNGRPLAMPVIGQHLVLFPGHYTFSGRFMAQRLRAGAGLVWSFTCTAGGTELARTPALTETQGRWQDLSLALEVPASCGAVRLQLRTHLGSDALAGLRGEAYFDSFGLSAR